MIDLIENILGTDYSAVISSAPQRKSKKPRLKDRTDDEIDRLVVEAIGTGVTGWEALCRACHLRDDGLCDALVRLMLEQEVVGCRYTGREYTFTTKDGSYKDLAEREYFLLRRKART